MRGFPNVPQEVLEVIDLLRHESFLKVVNRYFKPQIK